MENKEQSVDQSLLASDISEKIEYDFLDLFLVKQLDPIKVKKEYSKPVSEKNPKKDKDGIEAVDYDKVETEVKEVDSDFRKGIVLKIPMSYTNMENKPIDIKVGDTILFKDRSASYFDLLKDSRLVAYFNILAITK
jgi:co-chaperonin GroES (HSP10)